jgi:hypothetical protein
MPVSASKLTLLKLSRSARRLGAEVEGDLTPQYLLRAASLSIALSLPIGIAL